MFNCIATETCKFLRRVLKAVSGVVGSTWPCSNIFFIHQFLYYRYINREIILKSVHLFIRRSCLKLFFLFIAQAAILFNGAEWFEPFW